MKKLRTKFKHSSTPKADNAASAGVGEVFVSQQPSRLGRKGKLTLLFVGAALVVAIGTFSVVKLNQVAAPKKVDLQGLTEYSEMSREQADYYLYTKTGLSFELLDKKGINSKNIKSFGSAVQVAQAYASITEKEKALQAYVVAQEMKPNDGKYQFYLDYAHYALSAGDKATWKKEMLLAKDIVAKQPQPTNLDAESISPLEKINGEIVVVEDADATED